MWFCKEGLRVESQMCLPRMWREMEIGEESEAKVIADVCVRTRVCVLLYAPMLFTLEIISQSNMGPFQLSIIMTVIRSIMGKEDYFHISESI